VGRGGGGPTPLASQRCWRVYEENDFPLKATDKVGGSLLVIFLGGILCFQAIFKKERYAEKNLESLIPEDAARKRVVLALLAMLAASALFDVVGFVLTTFCLMLFLFRVIEPQRWKVDLFYVLIFTLGSYILFQVLLKVQLPTGFLGL